MWLLKIFSWLFVILSILSGLGAAFETWSVNRDKKRFKPDGVMINIGDRNLHIFCSGQGTSTVILEAGGGTPSVVSRGLQMELSTFSRVCSYDRSGLGWSEPTDSPKTFEQHADDLNLLIEKSDLVEPVILVAESYGGSISRVFATLYPEKVTGMILVDAAEEQHISQHFDVLRRQSKQAKAASWLAKIGIIRLLISKSPSLSSLPAEQGDRVVSLMSRSSHWKTAGQEIASYALMTSSQRHAGGLGTLGDLPLIVIRHGKPFIGPQAVLENDWKEAQERLADLSSNSRMIVASESGHAISLESPDVISNALKQMIDSMAR